MIARTVNGKVYWVYDQESVPTGLEWKETWKNSKKNDWVLTDDNKILQILAVKTIGTTKVYQTCIGTFSESGKMDTKKRSSRHTLSGKTEYELLKDRKEPTHKEILFAARIATGQRPAQAYLAVYDTKSEETAKKKSAILVKTERIQKILKQDLKDVFEKLGATTESMVEVVWGVAQNGKNDSDRLKAAGMMWDAANLVEKHKITEIQGLFQGFDPTQIEEFKRPEEITEGK